MVKQDLLTQCRAIPVFLLSLLLLFFSSTSYSQVSQISCNGGLQVSLNSDCEAAITPLLVLKGLNNGTPPFRIKVSGNGIIDNNTNSPIITSPGLYKYTITNSGGNSCWGDLDVEDKLGPLVDCACPVGNTSVACAFNCTAEAAFLAGTLSYPRPNVTENCSDYTTQISDQTIPLTCGSKIIRRTWVFVDAYGNKSVPCVSDYRFNAVDVSDATIPAPYNSVEMTCGSDVSMVGIFNFFKAKLYIQYRASYILQIPAIYSNVAAAERAANTDATAEAYRYAYPTINGVPITNQVCNIMAAKADTELDACGPTCSNSKKVIRLWTILNWCTSTTRTITQIIEASDKEAPTVVADDYVTSVDPWACEANFLLPAPRILHDNCSENVTYTVQGPIGVKITWDLISKRYLVTGAPKGVHIFTYIASDCCKNEGRDEITLTVLDKTAPIAIAKQNIVISLTTGVDNEGIAKLFGNSVDNGSYDSCTPVHLELRREEDATRDNDGCDYTGNKTYNDDGHPNDGSDDPSSPNYDPDGGAFVKFCCDDITNREGEIPFGLVKVWMRVWDDGNMSGRFGDIVAGQSDNYNETWITVRVEDKLTPQIICPKNITINCDQDASDLALTGTARAYSNCLDLETVYEDRKFVNSCNVGYIERTWKIKNRTSIVCVQRITVQNPFPAFAGTIQWPADITTNCTDDAAARKPTWSAGACDQIGLSLKSDTFYFEGNACMKILNRWTLINWCTYDPNANNPVGYFTRTQTVKVIDTEKPRLNSCADLMFEIDDNDDVDADGNKCEKRNLSLTNRATDQGQCASDWLKWIVFVDLWGDGTVDYEYSSYLPANDATFNDTNGNGIKDRYVSPTGQGGEVRIVLPEDVIGSMSNHKITWKVSDGCGNITSCNQNFMVVDKKKPTPYCLSISSALMLNGKVELWAVDFNLGSFDNCTSKSNLLYTFSEANPVLTKLNQVHFFKGAGLNATEIEYNAGDAQKWIPSTKSSGMVFNCDDLPSTEVRMTVWDEKLNYDFCTVTLNLNDNQKACGPTVTTSVSGKLLTSSGLSLSGAEVTLDNGIKEMIQTAPSATNGEYLFNKAVMNYDYTISGSKNTDYLNGVSTLDLVLIQRHILGTNKFTSPYNVIASDANNDNRISTGDLIELRKLILGIYGKLPNSDSWRFVNSNQNFTDINNPWPINEKITISGLDHEMINQNFVTVKVGDVNASASGDALNNNTGSRSIAQIVANDAALSANELHSVVLSTDLNDVFGFQFTLTLRNADLVDVMVGNSKISDENIAKLGDDKYTISWSNVTPLNGKDLITLNIAAKSDATLSNILQVNSSITASEIYAGAELTTAQLSLRFAGKDVLEFAVGQNEPNPFRDVTNITFTLPEAANATLTVFDVNGKKIYNKTAAYAKGENVVTVSKNDLNASGVMIYKIESGANTVTKKMIGLE